MCTRFITLTEITFALEGIVHAGKTTLLKGIQALKSDVCCINEYTVYRGFVPFPQPPTTSDEAMDANRFFLDLDSRRFADAGTSKVVLLDRSCISILAYHYATEHVSCGQIVCFEPSLRLYRARYSRYIPDVVLYLKISMAELARRHVGAKGVYKQDLLDEEFNRHLCAFYDNLCTYFPQLVVHTISGVFPPAKIQEWAIRSLRSV